MSLKYSTTTADYLVWSDAMNLIRKLTKDKNYKMSLLIALGCFTGLRISDILALMTSRCHFIDLQFFDLLTRSDYSDIKQWLVGL